MGANVTDLHGWITQQVETIERSQHEGRVALDEHERYDHTAFSSDPAGLRRCEADRRVLARHRLDLDQAAFTAACEGHGLDSWGLPNVENLNDCPELLDLAHAHGITPEILAGLAQPAKHHRTSDSSKENEA